jgi:hypothetical protein
MGFRILVSSLVYEYGATHRFCILTGVMNNDNFNSRLCQSSPKSYVCSASSVFGARSAPKTLQKTFISADTLTIIHVILSPGGTGSVRTILEDDKKSENMPVFWWRLYNGPELKMNARGEAWWMRKSKGIGM